MSGGLLRAFERDSEGIPIFSSPRNLEKSPDGTMIHITDREFAVITMGLYGKILS
jgi:hypothetical protein